MRLDKPQRKNLLFNIVKVRKREIISLDLEVHFPHRSNTTSYVTTYSHRLEHEAYLSVVSRVAYE